MLRETQLMYNNLLCLNLHCYHCLSIEGKKAFSRHIKVQHQFDECSNCIYVFLLKNDRQSGPVPLDTL